jgi:hypothetical protein
MLGPSKALNLIQFMAQIGTQVFAVGAEGFIKLNEP